MSTRTSTRGPTWISSHRRDSAPRVERRGGQELLHVFDGESGRVLDETYWSIEAKLDFMQRSGIHQSVVSLGNPWLEAFDPADSVAIAKDLNAELARMDPDTGGRPGGHGMPAERWCR